jgi:hypothetical protein
MEKKSSQTNGKTSANDSLIFEPVKGNDNVVKAISFNEGKKHEVFVYVISEEQFDALIPSSEKKDTVYQAVTAG